MEHLLHIKNMVCPRCITAVQSILAQKKELEVLQVNLGEARVRILDKNSLDYAELDSILRKEGFELIFDSEKVLTDRIKTELLLLLDNLSAQKTKLSVFLSQQLQCSYTQLSHCFSKHEKVSIEKYFILLKIEKIKELLSYNELTIKEIAFKLDYSSSQALSAQFKSIVGLSPSAFKSNQNKPRKSLDALT